MAAGMLSEPGSKYGPCEGKCHHSDCAETRRMAKSKCFVCGKPIGYGVPFFRVGKVENGVLEHAECAWDEIEQKRKQEGWK